MYNNCSEIPGLYYSNPQPRLAPTPTWSPDPTYAFNDELLQSEISDGNPTNNIHFNPMSNYHLSHHPSVAVPPTNYGASISPEDNGEEKRKASRRRPNRESKAREREHHKKVEEKYRENDELFNQIHFDYWNSYEDPVELRNIFGKFLDDYNKFPEKMRKRRSTNNEVRINCSETLPDEICQAVYVIDSELSESDFEEKGIERHSNAKGNISLITKLSEEQRELNDKDIKPLISRPLQQASPNLIADFKPEIFKNDSYYDEIEIGFAREFDNLQLGDEFCSDPTEPF